MSAVHTATETLPRWKPSRRLEWLADPSWLSGVGSLIDVFGSASWASPSRFTEEASSRMLHADFVVIGNDFWRAMRSQAAAEGLDIDELQPRLFDPAAFDAAR